MPRKLILALAALAALAAAALLIESPDDHGDEGEGEPAVGGLRRAGCPARYEVAKSRGHTAKETRRARRRNRFDVDGVGVTLEPPVRWSLNVGRSRSFRHQLHKLKWADVLFAAYRDGDVGALRQARDLVLDWVAANPLGATGTPAAAWADKRTGDRAPYVAYLLRAGVCEGALTRAQQRRLLRSLRVHAAELTDPGEYKPTNHGLFMDLGLALLAEQLPFEPGAERWRRIAARRFERTLLRRLDPGEGLWLEHSADYQVLLTKLVERFNGIEAVRSGRLERIGERMERVTAWLVMPDGLLLQSGDSHRSEAPDYAAAHEAGAEGLLSLPRSGLAVVREGGSYLALLAGFHNTTHKHADELSFDLFEDGTRVVSDTGLYNKDLGPEYEFAASARAHSGLSVDGVEPALSESRAYGSGLLAAGEGEGYYAILATNPLLRERGVRHHRLLLYDPGRVLVVVDSLRATREHTYTRRFQLGAAIEVERDGEALALRGDGLRATLTASGSAGRPLEARTVRGRRDPLAGLVSPDFRRWLPRTTASYEVRAADADLAAVIALDREPPALSSPLAERNGARITLDDVTLRVRRQGARLRLTARAE